MAECRLQVVRRGVTQARCKHCGTMYYSTDPAAQFHATCKTTKRECDVQILQRDVTEYRCQDCHRAQYSRFPAERVHVRCKSPPANIIAAPPTPPPSLPSPPAACGPGCQAKRILDSLHIPPLAGCDCAGYARRMDEWGVDGCREHFAEIVERFRSYASKYDWGTKLRAAALAVKTGLAIRLNPLDPAPGIVQEAIRRAEEEKAAPIITVVMPTYNQAKFLREAIDSLLAQTFRDFELIIVNDGSTDDTEAIVKSYADPRIKYLKKPNGGTGSALNEGFRHATGKYETWWASDNVLKPEAFQSLAAYLDAHRDVDYVYANCEIHTMDHTGTRCVKVQNVKDTLGKTGQEWDPLRFSHHYCLGIVWLWRLALRERVGEFSEANGAEYLCEDYDFALRASEVGRLAFLDRNLGWYRRHAESHSAAIAKETDPRGPYNRVIRRTRIRRFPRKAWFYWGERTLPYLRYLTLATFRKFNPDWQVTLYRPLAPQSRKVWVSPDQAYAITGRDYLPEVAKLGVRVETVNLKALGIDPALPDVLRSDLLRLHLLATQGGVWSDMDIIYFARLNFTWDHDTYLCPGPYGHSIGLLASTPDNPVFHFLLDKAQRAVAAGQRGYQAAGANLFNRHAADLARIDANNGKYYAIIDRTTFEIPMETVYAYDAMHIPAIHEPAGDGGQKFTDLSIGCHWYGGHALAGRSQNTITAENWQQWTSVLGAAIQRAMV